MASLCVGLTLPGMIDEPGSFSGRISSPKPQRGPEASQRMSLAIFISEAASVFSAPLAKTISSCAESAANLLGCDLNGSPVSSAIFLAARSPNSGCELRPVPTAVPPIARSNKPGSSQLQSLDVALKQTGPTRHLLADGQRRGVLQMRAADLDDVLKLFAFAAIASWTFLDRGMSLFNCSAAAMYIAVGNVSFDDCDMLTSSFG